MNMSPEYSEDELRDLDVKIPLLEGSLDDATATLDSLELKYEKIGNGIDVLSQYPLTGTAISKGGTVYLYTEKISKVEYVEVPDLRYNDLTNVNQAAEAYGVNYSTTGASPSAPGATVAKQYPEPGTRVPKGTVVELEFKLPDAVFND